MEKEMKTSNCGLSSSVLSQKQNVQFSVKHRECQYCGKHHVKVNATHHHSRKKKKHNYTIRKHPALTFTQV